MSASRTEPELAVETFKPKPGPQGKKLWVGNHVDISQRPHANDWMHGDYPFPRLDGRAHETKHKKKEENWSINYI